MIIVLKNFHIVDVGIDAAGSLVIEDGIIVSVKQGESSRTKRVFPKPEDSAFMIFDGKNIAGGRGDLPLLMTAFVDLHAHFRDSLSGEIFPPELLESASLAAVAGGFTSVVCMANTKPAIDSIEKAAALKNRSAALGLLDLYPVMSLTKNLEGKELSEITRLPSAGDRSPGVFVPLMLSEDGKDIADDALFLLAMKEAGRTGIPVSCHCDFGAEEAEAAKKAGKPRGVFSRIEENNAICRAIDLGKEAGCHIHIAHVSTKESAETIRREKAKLQNNVHGGNFKLTCEAMPHNIMLTEDDAKKLGEESFGRVNPPLRTEDDRRALIEAIKDGTIDAIATDHAPHRLADKEKGSPGFSGLETAFAVCNTILARREGMGFQFLSQLMSANPARVIGLGGKKGRLLPGMAADIVIADPDAAWIVSPSELKTRGKNSPFAGMTLFGKILYTFHDGRMVFSG